MLTTIIVSPRERFSSLPGSLRSLFSTISTDQPVIVVEGATPPDIRKELKEISDARPFEHIALPYPVTPNQARNIGNDFANTEYVVFSDNDIEYEEGWLKALELTAVSEEADAVAPLIFIGPESPRKVHHAGGLLMGKHEGDGLKLVEKHRLMNAAWPDVSQSIDAVAPVTNEVCEFHCAMVRRDFLNSVGKLDERLVTREQMDFALQAKSAGARVRFASDARVTYRAFDPIDRIDDLHYFLFRWSDEYVVASLDAFEENWNVKSERDRVRFGWTRKHRRRAVASYHRGWSRILGSSVTGKLFLASEEHKARERFQSMLLSAPEETKNPQRSTFDASTLFASKEPIT